MAQEAATRTVKKALWEIGEGKALDLMKKTKKLGRVGKALSENPAIASSKEGIKAILQGAFDLD